MLEGFTRDRLITQGSHQIDPRQFARAGHSTTDALVYLLQAVYIYEAVDTGSCGARLFFADYSKGFDMIEHSAVSIKHGLRTTDCGLGIKHGLGIKRRLENTDWV